MKSKHIRDKKPEEQWPAIIKALDTAEVIAELNTWCREHRGDYEKGMHLCRAALHDIISRRLKGMPEDEMIEVVAENLGSEMMKMLKERHEQMNAPEVQDGGGIKGVAA